MCLFFSLSRSLVFFRNIVGLKCARAPRQPNSSLKGEKRVFGKYLFGRLKPSVARMAGGPKFAQGAPLRGLAWGLRGWRFGP